METAHMRDFWDRRAREDAYFFVDNRRGYRDPELMEFWREGERDLDRMLELLAVRIEPTDVVLDIGCGVGRLTSVISARASRAYGIDVSSEMIERARSHHRSLQNVEWLVGDGMTLAPWAEQSVDACVSHVVFQHIPDRRVILGYVREMGRVLRPGGWAAFQVSNDVLVHRRRFGRRAALSTLRATIGVGPRGQSDPAWLGSAVSLPELREASAAGGLALERVVGEGSQFCLVLARKLDWVPSAPSGN